MKIVMDFRKYDGVVGGVEQGVIQIANYVANHDHEIVMLCKESKLAEIKRFFEGTPNISFIPLQVQTHAMTLQNVRLDSGTIQDIAEREGANIIHFPYNWSFPFNKKVPSVMTVHDVIPFTFREAMAWYRNVFLYKPGIRQACRLNTMVATVSEFSKLDIVNKVGVSAEKIRVIPNGLREPSPPDEELDKDIDQHYGLEHGFILNVGGIHERKNINGLIRAFAKLVEEEEYPGKLVITGSVSGAPYQEKMKKIIDATLASTGMQDKVIFTGFIPDTELDSLLRRAAMLVYPSFYEGFGIPILEAMRVRTPVITSNLTGMPEVAGDAAILIDPHDTDQLTTKMFRLLHDQQLREELVNRGVEKAASYSWPRTSKLYLDLYQDTIARETNTT
jgi:glycosyltransferase involved in cell wall biosynthesis